MRKELQDVRVTAKIFLHHREYIVCTLLTCLDQEYSHEQLGQLRQKHGHEPLNIVGWNSLKVR
jgi:hypothetical protein